MSLIELPERERNHPLFRKGYNLGVQDQAHREHMNELDNGQPLRQFRTKPGTRARFGVTSGVSLDKRALARTPSGQGLHDSSTAPEPKDVRNSVLTLAQRGGGNSWTRAPSG